MWHHLRDKLDAKLFKKSIEKQIYNILYNNNINYLKNAFHVTDITKRCKIKNHRLLRNTDK